jgi:hypothetical protein
LVLTTYAPTGAATAGSALVPALASLTVTGIAPSVINGTVLTPAAATLTTTGYAAGATVNHILTPSVATLVTTGRAPVLGIAVAPAIRTLTLTAFAPTATVSVLTNSGWVSLNGWWLTSLSSPTGGVVYLHTTIQVLHGTSLVRPALRSTSQELPVLRGTSTEPVGMFGETP